NGLTLSGQVRLLEGLLLALDVHLVIWYPGTNDIGCKSTSARPGRSTTLHLPWISFPNWILSGDLIAKNTAWLRKSNVRANQNLSPSFDLDAMRTTVERGVSVAKSHEVELIL